jgi:polysaccharide export outer membrane protein
MHFVCAVMALSLGSAAAVAQDAKPATPPTIPAAMPVPAAVPPALPNEPTLTIRNDEALKSFEPAANAEYELGPGDEISLDFPGRPELTSAGKQVIGPDGRITLPLAGAVHVADLTRTAAQQAIVDSLAKYYNDLTVTVRVDKYSSNRVRVLGYVQHPGEILFEGTPTLLDAIGRAGLISPTVSKDGVATNVGLGIPETCTIYRGNSAAVNVNLRSLLMTGNNLADLRLRRNDIVYVPQPKEMFVSVLGEVNKPGTQALTPESTLTSVLSQAGCCGEGGGFNPEIHILQPSTGKDFKIHYKDIMTLKGQTEYTLHSGDVILVPKSGLYKATWILQRISPVATMVSLATLVGF